MKKLCSVLACIATVAATLMASSACWVFFYQPEEPKCLRDE